MEKPLPNRMAVYLTAVAALLAGLAPVVADMDWESTAGILAGLAAFIPVVYKWLDNWGKYERGEGSGVFPASIEDEDDFDEETAPSIPAHVTESAFTPETTAMTEAPPPIRKPTQAPSRPVRDDPQA